MSLVCAVDVAKIIVCIRGTAEIEVRDMTMLEHVLYTFDLTPNVTIAQVMDLGGDVICAEYVD
ncbi:hypothetical protein BO71DRAFT_485806 [Aspergillus ellipticus CBS 707.79]|uniref:Uncharacterized protein n=1 Tax=Aspergillus ellipticus CBS 707.79 TaxID=1448320 RepID=A0A319DL81_9EURO|nr:hypothetical protein BO71DRAFT_485806 [Aspergillus ellipticus CBS 707.79]